MAHKLISAARQRYSRFTSRRSAVNPVNKTANHSHLIRRRSGLELTGAFLFIALLAAGGATLHADSSTSQGGTSAGTSPANGAAVRLSQTSSNTSSTGSDGSGSGGGTGAGASSTTQTTQVTSTSSNDNSTTKVTVDGKSVPPNTTVTNGDTTTTVTTNTDGSAVNTDLDQTSLDVSTPPNSVNVGQEVGVTPLMPY